MKLLVKMKNGNPKRIYAYGATLKRSERKFKNQA